jgi:aspartyl-tRNA(Asn)/glutamyl-tRNA(Gln) amidotransferase subunit A
MKSALSSKKEILKKSIRQIMEEKIPLSVVGKICKEQYEKYSSLNMYITPLMDESKINNSSLTAIPLSIKDNFLTENIKTTCASKMLSNFIAPYTATLVERLEKNSFVNFGKTNMDVFAMGSSGISSYYGACKSIWTHKNGDVFSPGGSSSGSAVSVATGAVFCSIGTDTSGSIRLPTSFCMLVGFKPTYGLLSRYGVIPLAESLDHPGFLTRLVDDCRYMFTCTIGADDRDLTTVNYKEKRSDKKKFAIIKEAYDGDDSINEKMKEIEECFINAGYEKKEYSIGEIHAAIAVYVILCRAECASNLQRYDGLRYGFRGENINNLEEQYKKSRTEGFGLEVKRRILTGGFVTSSENISIYVDKASSLRQQIKEKIAKIFEEADFILMPTAMGAMTLKEAQDINLQDPVKMQRCDLFTVIANLCGYPAISVPVGFESRNSPIGVDIMGQAFQDLQIMEYAEILENKFKMQEVLIDKIIGEE